MVKKRSELYEFEGPGCVQQTLTVLGLLLMALLTGTALWYQFVRFEQAYRLVLADYEVSQYILRNHSALRNVEKAQPLMNDCDNSVRQGVWGTAFRHYYEGLMLFRVATAGTYWAMAGWGVLAVFTIFMVISGFYSYMSNKHTVRSAHKAARQSIEFARQLSVATNSKLEDVMPVVAH